MFTLPYKGWTLCLLLPRQPGFTLINEAPFLQDELDFLFLLSSFLSLSLSLFILLPTSHNTKVYIQTSPQKSTAVVRAVAWPYTAKTKQSKAKQQQQQTNKNINNENSLQLLHAVGPLWRLKRCWVLY